jgi:hypothetical protein
MILQIFKTFASSINAFSLIGTLAAKTRLIPTICILIAIITEMLKSTSEIIMGLPIMSATFAPAKQAFLWHQSLGV